MKCPECSVNHPAKDGMRCKCGRQFVFHRKTDGISDTQFLSAVSGASANDTYYFTLPQLHAEACRRMQRNVGCPFGCGVTLLGLAIVLVLMVYFSGLAGDFVSFAALLAAAGLGFCIFAIYESSKSTPEFSAWETYVERWKAVHATKGLEKLIEEPSMHQPPPDWPEPDLYDYGFEKLIIVQRDILVDWLVLNNMHASERALIISETGYPQYLFQHAARTLEENPRLPVYLLHDPTPAGDEMQQRVRNSNLLALHDREIIDLGLSTADCQKMKGMQKIGADPEKSDVPIDTLRYGTLAGGVTAALATGVTLSYLLQQEAAAQKPGGTDGAGGGETYYGFG